MPEIRVLHVSVTFPSPQAIAFLEHEVRRDQVDILKLRGFIRAYKSFIAEAEEEFEKRVKELYQLRFSRSFAAQAAIRLLGRDREKVKIVLPVVPAPILAPVIYARNRTKYWLQRNTIVLRKRPMNIYLLPISRFNDFLARVREANEHIENSNALLREWRDEAADKIEEFNKRFQIFPDPSRVADKVRGLYIHRVYWEAVPIILKPAVAEEAAIPEEQFKLMMQGYVRGIVHSLLEEFSDFLQAVLSGQQPRRISGMLRRIEEMRSIASEVGLSDVVESVARVVRWVAEHPEKAREKYRSLEELRDTIIDEVRLW